MPNKQYLNLGTAIYEENKKYGIMVCGKNWGGEVDPTYDWNSDMIGASFFSDSSHNNQKDKDPNRFNNTLVRWFSELGHPLATTKDSVGPFEKSIFNTNWLRDQSPDMKSRDPKKKGIIEDPSCFDYHVEKFEPLLILLLSNKLLQALNSPECNTRSRELLGYIAPPTYLEPIGIAGKENYEKYSVGVQRFQKADVIALPHPRTLPPDAFIRAFKDNLSPIIAAYKAKRGFSPDDRNPSKLANGGIG